MQERVEDVIEKHGGTQTGWNGVTWDEGAIILTIAPENSIETGPNNARAAARDNCAAGKYCAYGKIGYGGNKLTYSACPATQTSFSIADQQNAALSGSVPFSEGDGVFASESGVAVDGDVLLLGEC